jgi:hypothetical protein
VWELQALCGIVHPFVRELGMRWPVSANVVRLRRALFGHLIVERASCLRVITLWGSYLMVAVLGNLGEVSQCMRPN